MKVVLQRVNKAQVEVDGDIVGQIGRGMLILLGIGKSDSRSSSDQLIEKLIKFRIFEDDQGKMNKSALEVNAEFLVVSQFTLYGNAQKGCRPSFDKAADPKMAEELYQYFVKKLKEKDVKVETGSFRAMMNVSLVNDGPVTFILES